MTFHQAPKKRRVATALFIAVAGLLLVLVPEQAEGKNKSKTGHHHASTAGWAAGKAKAKSKSKRPVSLCVDSYKRAKELLAASQVGGAKELLAKCTRRSCGRSLRRECAILAAGLKSDIPAGNTAVADASVATASRTEATNGADSKAAEPQSSESKPAAERQAGNGQQSDDTDAPDSDRRPSRQFAHKAEAREDRSEGGSSWPIYALGGVGLAGVGGYAALTWKGRQDNSTLLSSCAPDCNPASVHHLRMVYLAADISLGIGVVALAASTWLYLRSPSAEQKPATHVAGIQSLDVQATSGGAFATVGGAF